MGLVLKSEHLNGLKVFQPNVFEDERGFFMESYKASEFSKLGLTVEFLQDNHSRSQRGVLRGLHFQWDKPQGKLIRVTCGTAYVVEVDIRPGSPTLGQWFAIELSESNKTILWVPPGFANGFAAISEWVEMQYKCTAEWNSTGESAIKWNDPALAIAWPLENPIISDKDKTAQTLENWLKKPEANTLYF